MTLRGCLGRGEAQLRSGPHPGRARRDAESLLLHLTGKNRAWLMAHDDEEFGGCTAIQYAALLDRRRKGEPLQYITGETEFFGLPMRVTPDVLIPRPETEHLVEKALSLAQSFSAPRIADLGTGSGAIAIALAHALPHAAITATDISAAALAVAKTNAENNRVDGRIHFVQADLLTPLDPQTGNLDEFPRFDILVSNPPYVPEADRPSLSVEVRDYEPALALFAGNDGLAVYRRLIPEAFARLSANGWLALEIGLGQAPAIASLLAHEGFCHVAFTPDLQGIPRVASAQRCLGN